MALGKIRRLQKINHLIKESEIKDLTPMAQFLTLAKCRELYITDDKML